MKNKISLTKYCRGMKRRLNQIKTAIGNVDVGGMRIRQLEASLVEMKVLCGIVEDLWKKREGK